MNLKLLGRILLLNWDLSTLGSGGYYGTPNQGDLVPLLGSRIIQSILGFWHVTQRHHDAYFKVGIWSLVSSSSKTIVLLIPMLLFNQVTLYKSLHCFKGINFIILFLIWHNCDFIGTMIKLILKCPSVKYSSVKYWSLSK